MESPVTVDRAAEAREARRRRILENSSKRLEKITGRNAEEFEKGKRNFNPRQDTIKPSLFILIEKEREQIIYPDPDEEPILSEPAPQEHLNLFGATSGFAGGSPGQFPDMMNDENMAHIMQSLLSNMGATGGFGMAGGMGGGGGGQPLEEVPDNLIVKLIRTRIPIMLMAVVVFVMFHTQHSHLLSGNVLLSLLLWETVELFLLKFFNKLNAKRSKITFVLSLFNVPQHLVDRCLTMLGMVHKIIKDFSVFMFIFVLLHYAWGTNDDNDRV